MKITRKSFLSALSAIPFFGFSKNPQHLEYEECECSRKNLFLGFRRGRHYPSLQMRIEAYQAGKEPGSPVVFSCIPDNGLNGGKAMELRESHGMLLFTFLSSNGITDVSYRTMHPENVDSVQKIPQLMEICRDWSEEIKTEYSAS